MSNNIVNDLNYISDCLNIQPGIIYALEQFKNNNYQINSAEDRDGIDYVIESLINYFKVIDQFPDEYYDFKVAVIKSSMTKYNGS